MELVPVQDDSRWDALLEDQPNRSLYHTTAWLGFQAEQFGFDLRRLVIRHEGRPVGLFPLFLTRRGIFRVSASPRGVDYLNLGPLVSSDLLPESLDCYERWTRTQKVDYTSIAFLNEIDSRIAGQHGYKCERHQSCVVDLRGGEDAVFGRFSTSCRKAIRKAERAGLKIIEGDFTPHLDRYVELSTRIFAKSRQKTAITTSVLSAMLRALGTSGHLLSLRAELDGEAIGMYVVGHYDRTLYSLNIVTDYAFLQCRPSNLMTWHAIRWGCRNGLETFDMGGARIKGIAEFKQSFGGAITPYTNITRAHSLLARSASWLRKATTSRISARRFFRSPKGKTSRQTPAEEPAREGNTTAPRRDRRWRRADREAQQCDTK